MEEQKKAFVREQIKEKPISRRQLLRRVGISVLSGAAFALAAVVILLLFSPLLGQALLSRSSEGQGESVAGEGETQGKRDNETVDGTETGIETETETETETEAGVTEAVPTESESGNMQQSSENTSEKGTGDSETVQPEPTEPHTGYTIEDYQEFQAAIYAIGQQVNHSIVTVTGVVSDTDWFNNPYEIQGQGAGVIFQKTGQSYRILTERKSILDAERVSVTFVNGATVEAELEAVDGNTGLAVLSVAEDLLDNMTKYVVEPARFGDADVIKSGTLTLALGSPQGMNYSILTGTVTSTGNEISTIDANYRIFTTDISAGAEGSGILANLDGEIIGIVMQDYRTPAQENTLIAVSAADLYPVIRRLARGKSIPYLGLYVSTVTEAVVREYQLPRGVYVKSVRVDSPAMEGGIQSGDVITELNGEAVSTAEEYRDAVLALTAKDTCRVTVLRLHGETFREINCEVTVSSLY